MRRPNKAGLVVASLVAAALAIGGTLAARKWSASRNKPIATATGASFKTRFADVTLELPARLVFRSPGAQAARVIDLSVLVDGATRPLALDLASARSSAGKYQVNAPLSIGSSTQTLTLTLEVDAPHDAFRASLAAPAKDGRSIALRGEISAQSQTAFVSGVGEVSDRATVLGSPLVLDFSPYPLGVTTSSGSLSVSAYDEGNSSDGADSRLSFSAGVRPDGASSDLVIAFAESTQPLWRALYRASHVATAIVRGSVTGTKEPARVYGRNTEGVLKTFARTTSSGAFEIDAPPDVREWYAVIDESRASALASYVPGSAQPLVLDVSPGGELHVLVRDGDTKKNLSVRLYVRGIEGAVDPSFGPDYRASGAGPLIDALRGEVTTPLPSGKYRVGVTRGIEWSIDEKIVEIRAGHTEEVELELRHVVPTPNAVGCDFHVHARPSFDSPVSTEDRVLSLVSAGIDFAVPTEHNIVGDYGSAVEMLDVANEFAWVSGVEVTTYAPSVGHFGVFPYPVGAKPPPHHGVGPAKIFAVARAGDPRRIVQVHHPRLPKGIGYFSIAGYSPKAKAPAGMRLDFDAIEVFNGYDTEKPERVDEVLRDYFGLLNAGRHYIATGSSDSHRIQFHWAGYPRTIVALDPPSDGRKFADDGKIDPSAVVSSLRRGHATVTNGPVIELDLAGAHPGDDVVTSDNPVRGTLRVRTAPWIDLTSVEVIVMGEKKQNFVIGSRPTEVGKVPGSLDDAHAKSLRIDQALSLDLPEEAWVMVIARGARRMDDVLPFMPMPPLAFTNPIWIHRKAQTR